MVRDLLADLEEIIGWLIGRLRAGDALDAYLLAAGAVQIVEDYQHRDLWSIRRIAATLPGDALWPTVISLFCVPAAVADHARRALPNDRRTTRWLARLINVRNRLAPVVVGTRTLDEADQASLADIAQQLGVGLPRLPAGLRREVLRLPSCFRSFDQRPADLARLAEDFTTQFRAKPAVVVGVRTSGSYLAPLAGAALADHLPAVEIITVRPGFPLRRSERAVLNRAVRHRAHVVVVDDPPESGGTLRDAIRELRIPDDRVTLLVQSFDKDLPEQLRRYRAVTLPFEDWAVHCELRPRAVHAMLTDLLGSAVCDVQRQALATPYPSSSRRGHATALYRVQLAESQSELVVASGAGMGYLGRHAIAVADAVPAFVPHLYGFRNGLLFRAWLPEEQRLSDVPTHVADQIAAYIAAREARMPARFDRSRGLAGRAPVWEVASMLMADAFGRLGRPLRPLMIDAVARRLTMTRSPTIVDGDTGLHRWFANPTQVRTLTPDVRAFSNLDLACYDAAYDVAGVDPGGREPVVEAVRRRYEAQTGHSVDDERLLLYELVHLWDRRRNGHLTERQSCRASSRAVQRYFASTYLGDLPEPGDGPLVALDCDGVVETDPWGFPATTPGGALALRRLHLHGYRPVLATGRSLDEVRERCETYGLAGGVAEYGSVVYRHSPPQVVELVELTQRASLVDLRAALAATPGVEVDADYVHSVRASRFDHRGRRCGLEQDTITAALARIGGPPVQVVQGEGQTDFVATGVTKANGLDELAALLGSPEVAMAMGDSATDLPMLRRARLSFAPANASRAVRADTSTAVLRRTYQAGLSDAVTALLGHRPGQCPSCQPPTLDRRSRLLLAVLAAPELGRWGLPRAILRTAVALLRSGG